MFSEPSHRYAIGLLPSRNLQRLEASLLRCQGYRYSLRCEVADCVSVPVPGDLTRQLYEHQAQATTLAARTQLVAELTECAIQTTFALLAKAGEVSAEVRAIGVHGLGVWDEVDAEVRSYHSLCNAAQLAEATGFNVIDDFPARDLAQQGIGGPVEAAGMWLLLGERSRVPGRTFRGVVQLARSLQITVLPPVDELAMEQPLWAQDIGPGTQLLDELASRLTSGNQSIDIGGHLAVQGRRISALYHEWLDHPTYRRSSWRSQGVSATPLLYDAFSRALDENWSITDMLCTANHLLAESVARTIRREVPRSCPVGELILVGGGVKNGFLLREIRQRLPETPIRLIEEFGLNQAGFMAGSIAALAMLHIDQILVSPTSGAAVPRLRGRLTPGNPTHWHRLLREMHTLIPGSMALRNAI